MSLSRLKPHWYLTRLTHHLASRTTFKVKTLVAVFWSDVYDLLVSSFFL
jgi:hypothetical protein